jgi:hypothetical protein
MKSYFFLKPRESNKFTNMLRVKRLGKFRNITLVRPTSFDFMLVLRAAAPLEALDEWFSLPQDPVGGRIEGVAAVAAGCAAELMKQPGGNFRDAM